jgi:hypothetical protein
MGKRIRKKTTQITGDLLDEAIRTFGIETILSWDQVSDQIFGSIKDTLREQREEAKRTRMAGLAEMDRAGFKRALSVRRAQMLADALEQAKLPQILTGFIGGLSSILGGVFGDIANKREDEEFWRKVLTMLSGSVDKNAPVMNVTSAISYPTSSITNPQLRGIY